MPIHNIAIFASGRGSNAKAILDKESQYPYRVALLVVSKREALALELAKEYNLPYLILDRTTFLHTKAILETLEKYEIDLICLAGFLWKIPDYLIQHFPEKIINIHPSLLPLYGGKGMYGMHVHEAVIANDEEFSGITIHLVNANYDEGKVLFQEKIRLAKNETPTSLAQRILELEHEYFPKVIASVCEA